MAREEGDTRMLSSSVTERPTILPGDSVAQGGVAIKRGRRWPLTYDELDIQCTLLRARVAELERELADAKS